MKADLIYFLGSYLKKCATITDPIARFGAWHPPTPKIFWWGRAVLSYSLHFSTIIKTNRRLSPKFDPVCLLGIALVSILCLPPILLFTFFLFLKLFIFLSPNFYHFIERKMSFLATRWRLLNAAPVSLCVTSHIDFCITDWFMH